LLKKLPSYALAGFDLTAHGSGLLDGRRKLLHKTTPPGVNVMITIFYDFPQFSAKKLAFFLNTNVMSNIFQI
jgi:hypothetical protein